MGYLYPPNTFAVVIETLKQLARPNRRRAFARRPLRERTAEGVLRMLGKRPIAGPEQQAPEADSPALAFGDEERYMVSGVLTLADRSIHSIMTPRTDVSWIDLDDDPAELREQISKAPHSFFPVCRGSLDEVIGIGRAKEMIADLIMHGTVRLSRLRDPIIVHESIGVLRLMDTLKRSRGQLVLVTDEFGAIQGVVTPIDVFEAIAGEFPDEDEAPDITADGDNRWRADGAADLHHLELLLDTDGLVDEEEGYSTLAGYLLERFGHLPKSGDTCDLKRQHADYRFTVLRLEGRRIASVQIERLYHPPQDSNDEKV
jgi:CBS domain containing-hemolysin-like protein